MAGSEDASGVARWHALTREDGSRAGGDDPELRRLGQELHARVDEVVGMITRLSRESGAVLEPLIEQNFAKVGEVSTIAVARWMAGEGQDVAREVGMESWRIFGQLAAQRTTPLDEVTKRCLRWRDAANQVLGALVTELDLPEAVLGRAVSMVNRSFDVTLVRMCQSFEAERRRAQDDLAFLATHDSLTGLPNRTLILDRVEQMLRRSRRSGAPVATLFIDIDNFKDINDTLGHGAGDELLRAVASRLGSALRETDALGRLGGDEFVVVADGISVSAGPELIAERLLGALEEPFELEVHEGTRLAVTASIGIAMASHSTGEEMLRDADVAMYRAKGEGRNRYAVFQQDMQDAVQRRLSLEMDLRGAIERGQFYLVYQPIFELDGLRPTGIEALLRWQHPERGVVSPAEFIPILEESGMIIDVGRWVLRQACAQLAAWQRHGHRIGLAVNVSMRQIERDAFIEDVVEALEAPGLDPGDLTVEVTETAIMSSPDQAARQLGRLKELGIRVAIDDFGTGYSSLAYLQRFPVDTLKIDRSFVSQLSEGHSAATLIRTLVQLGESLVIETLAEGIEESDDLTLLRAERCDAGQGFLFTKPLDAEACERYLRDAAAQLGSLHPQPGLQSPQPGLQHPQPADAG